MRRRSLHIILIAAILLLSIGEAYHYHPDGGEDWYIATPFAASSSSTDAPVSDGQATANSARACLLHFWSSLLSTTSISLPVVLAPPARETGLFDRTPQITASGTTLPFSIRGPPAILS